MSEFLGFDGFVRLEEAPCVRYGLVSLSFARMSIKAMWPAESTVHCILNILLARCVLGEFSDIPPI